MPNDADATYRVTADELRQFIERFERLETEKKDIAEQQKDVMAEAKARGYDTKVIRKVIALRKRDKDDIAEEEAVLEMYKRLFLILAMCSEFFNPTFFHDFPRSSDLYTPSP